MAKVKTSGNMPQTAQRQYPQPGDLGMTNACPRSTEHDLEAVSSRTRLGSWGDEQTFKVVKKGNCP